MIKINSSDVMSYLGKASKKVSQAVSKSSEEISRELEMVPKYLEIAELPNGEYRFSPEDIKSLTKAFGEFDTALSKTDIVRDLIAIGSKKGEPLSIKEITAFLKSTSSLAPQEQQNVLKFIKGLKEVETIKYDVDFVKQNFIKYDDFKARELELSSDYYRGLSPAKQEERIQDAYQRAYNNEMRMVTTSDYYRQIHERAPMDITQIFEMPGYNYVENIGKCSDPETLASIVVNLGPKNFHRVKFLEPTLVDAYKLSGGNMHFVNDLLRGFYQAEAKAIVSALKEDPKKVEKVLKAYKGHTIENPSFYNYDLYAIRRDILKELKVQDKIELLPLSEKDDALRHVISGNYEGGKKR